MRPFPVMDVPELTAEVIKWCFEAKAAGTKNGQIALTLELNRIPNPGARYDRVTSWKPGMIGRLFKQTRYKGTWRRKFSDFEFETKSGFDAQGPDERYYDMHDEGMRIVTDELFASAQTKSSRSFPDRGLSIRYMLTGKVVCSSCGQPLAVKPSHGVSHLRCTHLSVHHECPETRFSNAILEDLALETVAAAMGPAADQAFQLEMRRRAEAQHAIEEEERLVLEAEIAELDVELAGAAGKVGKEEAYYAIHRHHLNAQAILRIKKVEELDDMGPRMSLEDKLERKQTSLAAAVEALRSEPKPIRPDDAEGAELLRTIADAIARVDLEEAGDGRFDVLVALAGKPWGVKEDMPPRLFERRIVTDLLGRKDLAERSLFEALETGRFRPSAEFLRSSWVESARSRFPHGVAQLVEAITMSVVLNLALTFVTKRMRVGRALRSKVTAYSRSHEYAALRAHLFEIHEIQHDADRSSVKRSSKKTQRDWMLLSRHPIARSPLTDPFSGATMLEDRHLQCLMEAGVALPPKKIRSRRGARIKGSWLDSDWRYAEALLFVLRNGIRYEDLPKAMGSPRRVQLLRQAIDDHGVTDAFTRALLRADGIEMADDVGIPPLVDHRFRREHYESNPNRRRPATYDRTVLKRGRKPLLSVRRRALSLAKQKEGNKNAG